MSLAVIGTDYARAPIDLRDRLALADERLDALLEALVADPAIDEAAVLSTCNRTEIYVAARNCNAALAAAEECLAVATGVARADIAGVMERLVDDDAVRHLFAVAAGLCSLAIGETQILTQVREAFEHCARHGVAGPQLQALARAAVQCGKRVRTETALASADTSVGALAVETAARRLGGLDGRAAVLIGAGRINRECARLLRRHNIGELVVVSRTLAAAAQLAAEIGARAAPMNELPPVLAAADLAIAATRAPDPLVVSATIAPRPRERPLLLLDIAVPRDVDPTVAQQPGVAVIDMDDLRAAGALPEGTVTADAWRLVDECAARFGVDMRVRRAVPVIARLRAHVDRQKDAELERALAGLGHLAPDDREAVALLAHRLVNRMFHHLATRLKAAAAEPNADAYLEALSFLFDETGTEQTAGYLSATSANASSAARSVSAMTDSS